MMVYHTLVLKEKRNRNLLTSLNLTKNDDLVERRRKKIELLENTENVCVNLQKKLHRLWFVLLINVSSK